MAKPQNPAHQPVASHDQVIQDCVQLIRLMGETGLAELDLETPRMKMVLRRESTSVVVQGPAQYPPFYGSPGPGFQPGPSQETPVLTQPTQNLKPVVEVPVGHPIVSPMAGTFYRSSSPTSEPYVKEGDLVKPGQTVCIVEAMKLMNELKSDVGGKVLKILFDNGQPVEKDSILFRIQIGG